MPNLNPFHHPSEEKPPKAEQPIGFEPEDKPTPTAGKILLIFMAILLIFLGSQGLRDIENIPTEPERLSHCSIATNYNSKIQNCNFSKYEKNNNVPSLYQNANDIAQKHDNLAKQNSTLNSQLTSINNSITKKQKEYDLSLQESIADESRVGSTPDALRAQLQNLEASRTSLNSQIAQLEAQISSAQAELRVGNDQLKQAFEKSKSEFKSDNAKYEFWVFIIRVLFVFPVFFIFLKLYLNLKAKDSPHTIIATTLLGVSGLFVVGITIIYLWGLFLQRLLEILSKLFLSIPIFRTLLYYGGMLLVIIIFGGAVYHLQKKIFNPQRVRLRRLRAHKCPYCEFPFDFSKNYCPSCGTQLKTKCVKCQEAKFTIMKHCPVCGAS